MIDFSTLQGLTIPEGVVTQITDAAGNVLWGAGFDGTFKVAKITSNTYAGDTDYSSEQFILLDIYPKTNGTVSVTYEGLTKTITDTSGAAEPNAQQVFFGTFNGVSDETETPSSGIVTITGDWRCAGCGSYAQSKSLNQRCKCITAIGDLSGVEIIPDAAYERCTKITNAKIPNSAKIIGNNAFYGCDNLGKAEIPNGVTTIGNGAFSGCGFYWVTIPASVTSIGVNPWETQAMATPVYGITVDSGNTAYKVDSNCLIEIATNTVICCHNTTGSKNAVTPSYVEIIGNRAFSSTQYNTITISENVQSIGDYAFYYCGNLKSVTIPISVASIGSHAFNLCTGLTDVIMLSPTPPTLGDSAFDTSLVSFTVPAGCGDTYKAASGWSTYANKIVEAS